jgi:hypothetical protein
VAVLALASGALAQTTETFTPSKDNTLIEMAGWPDLSSGQGDLFAGGIAQQNEFGNAYKRRALLRFDLSSIPANAVISSATLRVRVTKTIAGTYQFNLYRMLADWGEGASNSGGDGTGAAAQTGDATWNYRFFGNTATAWVNRGGDFSNLVSGTTNIGAIGQYTFTGAGMRSDVQGWVDGTKPNYGWMMTSDLEFLTSIAKRISSREATAANRPLLTVVYTVPAPTCGTSDFNGDGDFGTDADIEAFFACLGGTCCVTCWQGGADFNGDGDIGDDADIESFFRVLAGAPC